MAHRNAGAGRGQAAGGGDVLARLADLLGNLQHGRDRFRAPKYNGSTEVDLFLQQFDDVREAN